MTPNAFWGSQEVVVVTETGWQLEKELEHQMRETSFKKVE